MINSLEAAVKRKSESRVSRSVLPGKSELRFRRGRELGVVQAHAEEPNGARAGIGFPEQIEGRRDEGVGRRKRAFVRLAPGDRLEVGIANLDRRASPRKGAAGGA